MPYQDIPYAVLMIWKNILEGLKISNVVPTPSQLPIRRIDLTDTAYRPTTSMYKYQIHRRFWALSHEYPKQLNRILATRNDFQEEEGSLGIHGCASLIRERLVILSDSLLLSLGPTLLPFGSPAHKWFALI